MVHETDRAHDNPKGNASTFSLLTLFLVVSLAGALLGMVAFQQRAVRAEAMAQSALAEVRSLRAKFGHIEIDDPNKTYFARMTSTEGDDVYRAVFPAESRYMLHVSDVAMQNSELPDDLKPTKTMSMNGWRDGADVILKWGVWHDDGMRFVVRTQTDELFNYEINDWDNGNHPNEGFDLATDPQAEFESDEKVILSYFGNDKLGRGIILWLEPYEMWEARRAQK